eukprot:scaffold24156_cov49-Phaeocystis_antarctica.AAC.1
MYINALMPTGQFILCLAIVLHGVAQRPRGYDDTKEPAAAAVSAPGPKAAKAQAESRKKKKVQFSRTSRRRQTLKAHNDGARYIGQGDTPRALDRATGCTPARTAHPAPALNTLQGTNGLVGITHNAMHQGSAERSTVIAVDI